jgi:hypothetical protein
MSARKKECNVSTHKKQSLNVRTRESSKTERILLAKNRREKNPQVPAKQGRAVRHLPPAYARTTITSKSPSEAVFIIDYGSSIVQAKEGQFSCTGSFVPTSSKSI